MTTTLTRPSHTEPRIDHDSLPADAADADDHALIADVYEALYRAAALLDNGTAHTASQALAAAVRSITDDKTFAAAIHARAAAAIDAVPGYTAPLTLSTAGAAIRAADLISAAHPYVDTR